MPSPLDRAGGAEDLLSGLVNPAVVRASVVLLRSGCPARTGLGVR
ncbi:hypothetical protein [Amycolatopsis jejuensis]|nr:hypothetical protein [Amycolatopsis jejuensis]